MGREANSPISVLIVDDDGFCRAQLQSWLQKDRRFQCIGSASDGAGGLQEICSKRPSLAVIELVLPGMSGVDVIWRAREQLPSVIELTQV